MLSVGNKVIVETHEIDSLGQGVARLEDFVIFIKGLLANEKAEVQVTKLKKRFAEAKIIKIISPSNDRKSPTSHLGSLDLYHLNDDKQVQWQKEITEKNFKRAIGFQGEISDVIKDDNEVGYRNKVVYHVMDKPHLTLGLYKQYPVELTFVQTFILSDPVISNLVSKLTQKTILINPEILKHIVFRSNGKKVLVTLVATTNDFLGLDTLKDILSKESEVIGITLNIKKHEKVILSDNSILLYGKNQLDFTFDNNYKLSVTDQSFMQVNTPVMLKTYKHINARIIGNSVIDAYSGIGSIAFSLTKKFKKITLIENQKSNVEMAEINAKNNHAELCEIIEGDTEKILPHLESETLIVDPPRNGLHQSLLSVINQKEFKQVIYLSCDIQTLLRDLKVLTEVYKIDEVVPIRMFPQTSSIETLVILSKI